MARLLIPLLAGIIAGISFNAAGMWIPSLMIPLVIVLVAWVSRTQHKPNYSKRWIFGVLLHLLLLMMGMSLVVLKKEILSASHFSHFYSDALIVTVDDAPREKESSMKVVLRVNSLMSGRKFMPVSGHLLAYLSKDSISQLPEYGDLMIVFAKPVPVPPPLNPGIFDYKRFLEYSSIYQQVYLKNTEWKILKKATRFSVKRSAIRIRDYCMNVLARNSLSGKELSIAAALLLGQDEILDFETRKEYSSAGVVHILGISGLHVGILYLVFNFLFGFLDKKRRGRILKLILVLGLIWFYALMTGLSPAALRSSAMFSFVSFGKLGKRNVHIINSLATSAFLLLLMNPFLVCNIGFQFSYIAVAGIVLFHPGLYKKWEPRYWLPDQVWSLVAMSVAAQFVTFPITLYYFHQFPVYFLPANLVAIPVSNLVIYCGMALLVSPFFPFLSNLIGLGTSYLLKFLTLSVHFIEELPYSVIHSIRMDMTGTLLLYAMILSFAGFIHIGKRKYLLLSLTFLLAFNSWNTLVSIRFQRQQKLLVFAVKKHTAIGLITRQECLLLADHQFLEDPKLLDFTYGGSKSLFGIQQTIRMNLDSLYHCHYENSNYSLICMDSVIYFQVAGSRVAILSGRIPKSFMAKKLVLDILILTGNPRVRMKDILSIYSPKLLVLDASNSAYRCELWKKEASGMGVNVFDSKSSGAYIADFQ
jgi:competence protein ComEC